MKKTLLLIAGCPGTGKSYLDQLIRNNIEGFVETSIDLYKEKLYDEIGFDDLKERTILDNQAYDLFYKQVGKLMEMEKAIISDYPFSYKQKKILTELSSQYSYQIITITLIADEDVLYQRQAKRDLQQDRHLGHVMTHYHKGDYLEDRSKIEIKKTKEEFEKFNQERGYANFSLGKTFFIDVTDFTKVNYSKLIDTIRSLVK